jgi:xylulokinase
VVVEPLLLALDLGTTGIRAGVFSPSGQLKAEAQVPCGFDVPHPGWAEADADRWWDAIAPLIASLGADVRSIVAVGVVGQAPTVVLVDSEGGVVRPAILWLDTRADSEARALEWLGPRALALGGNRLHSYFLGPKLRWLRDHEPESLERAAYVLQSHSFVVFRLTGAVTVDRSTAALFAPLYDASTGDWALLDEVGIEARLFPPLVGSHEVAGMVTEQAARATGLPVGIPVVVGGGDFAAAALGAGVVDEGQACLMLGTAGNLLVPQNERRFDARLINTHHVGCDRYLSLGGTLCGAALSWFQNIVGVSFEVLEADGHAGELPLFLPYLQGERTPIWNANARGAFLGLSTEHGRGALYGAVLEGIALSFRECAEVVAQQGLRVSEVVATDGGGRSARLRQVLADALGVRLLYAPGSQGTLAGAALLAGLGTGLVDDATSGRSWRGPTVEHAPDLRRHELLQRRLEQRRRLYGAMAAREKPDL